MTEQITVVIPVQKDTDWDKARATNLPTGTPYVVAEYDPGCWAEGVNDGVKAAETPLVLLSASDAWVERNPDALDFLASLAWDCDVTYGTHVQWDGGEPKFLLYEGQRFCPHRLTLENYLPPIACVRKSSFLEAGGVTSGMWDLWARMSKQGARFKHVPEAVTARDGLYDDHSPPPAPDRVDATFYYQATPATAYWRCLLPALHLPGQAVFNIPNRVPDEAGNLTMPNHHGAAVMQYAGNLEHHMIGQYLQEQGHRVLAEIDDNYVRWFPQVMRKAGWWETKQEAPENGFSVEQHVETVRMADGVIVTSEYLAKQYRPYNQNVYVCPNQIEPSDWPEPVKPDDGKFRIGWFASASHRGDGQLIVRALEWASRQPDVEVVLIGVGATNGKPWYQFPFKHIPWSNDLGVYRRFLGELDVGLCPVVATPWAACRSDLKALEYAMGGALPIVSDVPPYEGLEIPGVVHCPDAKAFLRAVQWAVANRDEARQLAGEAREYVLAERTVEANIDRWRTAVVG